MKKILLYLWQLPQNIVGLFVVLFSRAAKMIDGIYRTKYNFGVSLGNYIILDRGCSLIDIRHEQGHQKQSLYLGWLYLFTIGILSAAGNIWDRLFHKSWNHTARMYWYYKQPWEAWADKLGGVKRW